MSWISPPQAAQHYGIAARTLRERAQLKKIKRNAEGLYWVEDEAPQQAVAPASGVKVARFATEHRVSESHIRNEMRAKRFTEQNAADKRSNPKVSAKKGAPEKPRMVVWVSDVHVPFHDVKACAAWLEFIKDQQPDDIILGGDIVELESCSSHGGVAEPLLLQEEAESGKAFCQAVRKACPNADISYLEGNHESRLGRIVVEKLPTLDGALTITNLLGLKDIGIKYVKDKIQIGKLTFIHGLWTTKNHASTHLERFGVSVCYGHTHRPQLATRATAASPFQAGFGMPCMRTLEPDWMNGAPPGWAHGFGVFYFFKDGTFTPYMPFIVKGRFVWNGKVYDGSSGD